MEPLFRLALIRPAVAQDPDNPSIRLSHDSPFQRDLAEALSTERPREESQQVARDLVTNNGFIGNPGANPLSNQLTDLAASLDRLERQAAVSHADVVAAVNQAFDSNPRVLVQEGTLDDPMAKLRDSLLAIKLLQEEHGRPIEALTNQLRDLELIVKVAEDNNFPDTAAKLRRYRRRSLLLPSEVDLQSILSTAKLEEDWRENLEEAEAEQGYRRADRPGWGTLPDHTARPRRRVHAPGRTPLNQRPYRSNRVLPEAVQRKPGAASGGDRRAGRR
jgi:outer membrane murein-binding lipoprotein Lpp